MGKSVYSVVLDDAVVRAVDAMAGSMGCSRSAAINRILAQHVQMDTPEQQMQRIFRALEEQVASTALQALSASAAQMQLRSPLRYKYNPTVKYQLELYRPGERALGVLRVSLRTQNRALLGVLAQFYRLWAGWERLTLGEAVRMEFSPEDGRFARELREPRVSGPDELAGLLAGYINLFDGCLKEFFEYCDRPEIAAARAAALYRRGLSREIAQL